MNYKEQVSYINGALTEEAPQITTPLSSDHLVDVDNPDAVRFLEYLSGVEKLIVFSPHLDDAVLSSGSLITWALAEGKKIDIVTVFTEGSDVESELTDKLLEQSGSSDAAQYFRARREEDVNAVTSLGEGIALYNLGEIDAAWRRAPERNTPLYPITTLDVTSDVDRSLGERLRYRFNNFVQNNEKIAVFAPLGRGRHVDHRYVRDTIASSLSEAIFYSDFPYSDQYANEDEFINSRNLTSVEWRGNYAIKRDAILKYRTQRRSLFGNGPLNLPYERYFMPPSLSKRT